MVSKKLANIQPEERVYAPIKFDNGDIIYSSEDVKIVVEDYYRQAERSIETRRTQSKYFFYNEKQKEALKNGKYALEPTLSREEKILARIKEEGDYNWIIRVCKARNEIDPMRELRFMLNKKRLNGKSTIDMMEEEIKEIAGNPNKSYVDMARAKFNLDFLEKLSKTMNTPNVTINNIVKNETVQESEKKAEKVIDISQLRSEAKDVTINEGE